MDTSNAPPSAAPVRAANVAVRAAKAVTKATDIMQTAQAAAESSKTIVAAIEEGDGRGLVRTVGGAILDAATGKVMGKKGRSDLPKKSPPPNQGFGPKHGNTDHDNAINQKADEVRKEGGENIRKNQRQTDIDGNQAGTNKPDLQWDKDGEHNNWEIDRTQRSSERHQCEIPKNDPKSKNTFERIKR